jgi:ribonuclease P protein component
VIIKRHRFHGYGSLNAVYGKGMTVRGPMMSLKYNHRTPNKPWRAAVVVSRKVSKSAVTRNRIRRRLFEIVRRHEADIQPATDFVFTVFDEKIKDLEPEKLETIVQGLLQKAAKHR